MKKLYTLCMLSIVFFTSCTKSSMDDFEVIKAKIEDGPSNNNSVSQYEGIWKRNDGQASTYLKLNGTVAQTCNGGTITTGTFDSSVPSATFVVSGQTYVFTFSIRGSTLIMDVPPNSGNPNHIETEYIKSTNWPC